MKPVFANVTARCVSRRKKIFGQFLSILTYKTEAEAIEIANDTEFGLIAYVDSDGKNHPCGAPTPPPAAS